MWKYGLPWLMQFLEKTARTKKTAEKESIYRLSK